MQGKHHNHIGMCDVDKLDASGQYCAEVVGIPNLAQRISSFIFVRQFEDNLQRVSMQPAPPVINSNLYSCCLFAMLFARLLLIICGQA